MEEKSKLIIALVFFGVVFSCIGILLFFLLIKPQIDTKKILNNGAETTAAIIGADSNVRKGKEQYFHLTLTYVNSDGEKVTVKTDSVYPESFIKERGIAEYNSTAKKYDVTKEQFQVMYIGSKAVVKDFVPEDTDWKDLIAPLAFGIIGIVILLALILGPVLGPLVKQNAVLKAIVGFISCLLLALIFGGIGAGGFFGILKPPMDTKKILRNGAETTAAIIDIGSNLTSKSGNSEERYYYLGLSYVNSEGENITVKTTSLYPERFIRDRKIAAYNKNSGMYNTLTKETVQVKYIGNKAVVKGFVPKNEPFLFWFFPIIFGGIGAAFLTALIMGVVKAVGAFFFKHIIKH